MNALILLATLKKKGVSNTQTFAEYFAEEAEKKDIATEIVKLVDHTILPGTCTDMGTQDGRRDEWPEIFQKIIEADILIFATPIWWDNYSSEMQRVIERLDEVHDEILDGKKSKLEGKLGGVLITGDGDGGQHVASGIFNFFNSVGVTLLPYTSIQDLSEKNAKDKNSDRDEQFKRYKKDHAKDVRTMLDQMLSA